MSREFTVGFPSIFFAGGEGALTRMPHAPSTLETQRRASAIASAVVCYTLPLLTLTAFNSHYLTFSESWSVFCLGLVTVGGGSIALFRQFIILQTTFPLQLEQKIGKFESTSIDGAPVSTATLEKQLIDGHCRIKQLGQELLGAQQEAEALLNQKTELLHRCESLSEDLEKQTQDHSKAMSDKVRMLEEYQQTITDQRGVISKKESHNTRLETQVQDLRHELKTLLEVASRLEAASEIKPALPVRRSIRAHSSRPSAPELPLGIAPLKVSDEDAQAQLNRCIDIAQKLTGARHLAGDSTRFRDLSVDGYALDLRRLCDSLQMEHGNMIILYSQKEERLLFVNDQVRNVLGWSPDKFVQQFSGLMIQGSKTWRAALQQLVEKPQLELTIELQTRGGEPKELQCKLGRIPSGIFKTHVVGVCYPNHVAS